ncbi:hydroxymethylbilane synthase, partial [Staphylococcus sp. SIMBA_130]
DDELKAILEKFSDKETTRTVLAERAFLHTLEGGCQVPIAGHATLNGDKVTVTGLVGEPDGSIIIKEMEIGSDPIQVG